MKLLITGGAGFIGSNLILHLHEAYPDYHILNADKLTYASDLTYLKPLEKSTRYSFSKTDIVDRDAVRQLVRSFKPDGIIHLAAESHVDNSITGPEPFILTNVLGTFNLLEECRAFWNESGKDFGSFRFHHVSTDEVYGTLGDTGLFSETTPYAPNSPYSASKASSDFIVRSYHHTYGMNVVTTNCSNNYGPHQHDEKLIPVVIRTALNKKPIPVYGKGENIRDWLFVRDHCKAIDMVFHEGRSGETYNVGGRNEWKNIDLVRAICDELNELAANGPNGDYKNLITFVTDRPGHDLRYAIDATKLENELGWQNTQDFRRDLRETVNWYKVKYGF
ncbi:MAG: dTDP-glucose 4,6-dehydratase [Candidatus Cyclonatronum sp.]|uniref:dTDP-glucose 4,6-dehydratase n=1 Tax=Cyclonatronum sp. TaxID=3024185 RepID=UPI0025B97003|nr:dTDP-glucose 4,6-dehydratase [Cyclonatronum sp.]MCH8485550.1 dTDP-glucose 4,6-dehydratase [Cyclonatronum sp.]